MTGKNLELQKLDMFDNHSTAGSGFCRIKNMLPCDLEWWRNLGDEGIAVAKVDSDATIEIGPDLCSSPDSMAIEWSDQIQVWPRVSCPTTESPTLVRGNETPSYASGWNEQGKKELDFSTNKIMRNVMHCNYNIQEHTSDSYHIHYSIAEIITSSNCSPVDCIRKQSGDINDLN